MDLKLCHALRCCAVHCVVVPCIALLCRALCCCSMHCAVVPCIALLCHALRCCAVHCIAALLLSVCCASLPVLYAVQVRCSLTVLQVGLWWNWEIDESYAGFQDWIKQLRDEKGIRMMTYINPMLTDVKAQGT